MVQNIVSGTYFLHVSFLKEVALGGITKFGPSKQLLLLHSIIFPPHGVITNRISCDRALKEMAKSRHSVGFMPGILTLINEKSYHEGELEDDEYALKIASREKISSLPIFFIVTDSNKIAISQKASTFKYNLNVLSPSDF